MRAPLIENEIIRNRNGNTYIGPLATKFSYNSLTLPDLPVEGFNVIEVIGSEVIHRANQSTLELAMRYMQAGRVLVHQG